jgi:hypothetical protein
METPMNPLCAFASMLTLSVAHHIAHAQLPPQRFDSSAWQADYTALKTELERSYSHLAWFGSPQSGVNLPRLDSATHDALYRVRTDADAAEVMRRFVAGFRDGHLAPSAAPAPAAPTDGEPPVVNAAKDARTACAAFGYAPVTRVNFSLPFETLPGFELLADGSSEAFRAGLVTRGDLRIGIVRIPRFRATEFAPVCERAWRALRARNRAATRSEVAQIADEEWLATLAERLRGVKAAGAATVLVDIGGNGGGNDLGDWAVRLFSRTPVRSAPLLLSASLVAVPYFDEEISDLRGALATIGVSKSETRTALQTALAEFEQRKRDASTSPCDMSWVWREQRQWGTSPCVRLIPSGFMSGPLPYADRRSLDSSAARTLYWASRADPFLGAWDGPTYVLTNSGTGSAAELFVALMRDSGIAKTVGTRTVGAGCGFMNHNQPFVLPHSRLAFAIPNCVRSRADGTDEVAGIAPDIEVKPSPGESVRALAARALEAIIGDARKVK